MASGTDNEGCLLEVKVTAAQSVTVLKKGEGNEGHKISKRGSGD